MSDIKIFSGTSNLPLAERICSHLNIPLGEIYHHVFPSGESYAQFKENIRGRDVFLIQGNGQSNANDHFMRLLVMVDAAKRASAARITAVTPMSFYTRQDRKCKSRDPISAKLAQNMMTAAGVNRILTMDLHSPQIAGFTDLPMDCLAFEPLVINYIKKKYDFCSDLRNKIMIMGPDVGSVKRVEKHAMTLKCDFGFISKRRIGDEEVEFESIVGDVRGKNVILIDDMSESCATLIQAAIACKANGATAVDSIISHMCITDTGMERLNIMNKPDSPIDNFIHSDTINHLWNTKINKPDRVKCISTSELFAKAINNIHNDESVSELFC
jgi:ribose-phosphate pyrophosphokinase